MNFGVLYAFHVSASRKAHEKSQAQLALFQQTRDAKHYLKSKEYSTAWEKHHAAAVRIATRKLATMA